MSVSFAPFSWNRLVGPTTNWWLIQKAAPYWGGLLCLYFTSAFFAASVATRASSCAFPAFASCACAASTALSFCAWFIAFVIRCYMLLMPFHVGSYYSETPHREEWGTPRWKQMCFRDKYSLFSKSANSNVSLSESPYPRHYPSDNNRSELNNLIRALLGEPYLDEYTTSHGDKDTGDG